MTIKSKPPSKEFDVNYDKIFRRKQMYDDVVIKAREQMVMVPKAQLNALLQIHKDCEGVSYSYHWRDAEEIWQLLAAGRTK